MNQIGLTDGASGPENSLGQLLQECEGLSTFQLFQLRHKIDEMLSDPNRINAARSRIRPGDSVEYFDAVKNRCVWALVESCHRTRASVKNLDDGEAWRIEYVSINVDDDPTQPASNSGATLHRDQVAIGDLVGFTDKQNCDRIGEVIKRNPKTAAILCEDGTRWRVSYSYLFSVLDANGSVKTEFQPRLTFDNSQE